MKTLKALIYFSVCFNFCSINAKEIDFILKPTTLNYGEGFVTDSDYKIKGK